MLKRKITLGSLGCSTGLCPPKATTIPFPTFKTMTASPASAGADLVSASQTNEIVAAPAPAPTTTKASINWLPLILGGIALAALASSGDEKKEKKESGLNGVSKPKTSPARKAQPKKKTSSKRVKSYSI